MIKIKFVFIIIYCLFSFESSANDENFNTWLKNFKLYAQKEGISIKTVNSVMDKAIFLPKVIEYDRYQPEFYEDTFTYINKRTNEQKVVKGKEIYLSNFLDRNKYRYPERFISISRRWIANSFMRKIFLNALYKSLDTISG